VKRAALIIGKLSTSEGERLSFERSSWWLIVVYIFEGVEKEQINLFERVALLRERPVLKS